MIILTIILVKVLCCHSITKITRNGINGAMFVTYVLCRNTTIQTHFIKVHIKITIFNICVLEDEIKYPFNMNINKLGLHPKGVLNATCVDQQPVRKSWSTVH